MKNCLREAIDENDKVIKKNKFIYSFFFQVKK